MRQWILLTIFAFASLSARSETRAEILIKEFQSIKTTLENSEPDGLVGNLYNYVQRDGYIVMFSQEFQQQHDVIRFFRARETPRKNFAITYIWSQYLFPERKVLRRFVGAEPSGWKNHTVDVDSGEYFGSQGLSVLSLTDEEKKILEEWNIQLL